MKKFSRAFNISIVLLLLLAAWILFAPFLAERLIVEKPLERADVILVLAGSSVYLERTDRAAEIYKQGGFPKIVLTDDGEKGGWSRVEQRNPPYVELARKNLIAQGVPSEAVEIIKPNGSGTIYEARIFREAARRENWKSILIVTSPYHTRRALWTLERQFADEAVEIGIAAAPAGRQTPPLNYWWLTPHGWNSVAGEYVKSWYYWVYY
ncbi:MAG: YdcF family protein [Pyrinomonadaceae bacterium]|nr:YdcF family protein [Pyrinomonadaceae bacterium]